MSRIDSCGHEVCSHGVPMDSTCHLCARSRSHEHLWAIGHIATEGVGYPGLWTQVVYLVCQCGATKRSVPE